MRNVSCAPCPRGILPGCREPAAPAAEPQEGDEALQRLSVRPRCGHTYGAAYRIGPRRWLPHANHEPRHPDGYAQFRSARVFAVLCYCESMRAVLMMHMHKFRLVLCYCESIQAMLIMHISKFQLVLYYRESIYVMLITPIHFLNIV